MISSTQGKLFADHCLATKPNDMYRRYLADLPSKLDFCIAISAKYIQINALTLIAVISPGLFPWIWLQESRPLGLPTAPCHTRPSRSLASAFYIIKCGDDAVEACARA